MNKAILIGHVGKKPEIKNTQTGGILATFSLATTERWRDKQGTKQERTEWHNVTAFGRTAEVIAEYVKKGDKLAIEGRIQTDKWMAEDGTNRYSTKIILDKMEMLGGAKAKPQQQDNFAPQPDFVDDDIPF